MASAYLVDAEGSAGPTMQVGELRGVGSTVGVQRGASLDPPAPTGGRLIASGVAHVPTTRTAGAGRGGERELHLRILGETGCRPAGDAASLLLPGEVEWTGSRRLTRPGGSPPPWSRLRRPAGEEMAGRPFCGIK